MSPLGGSGRSARLPASASPLAFPVLGALTRAQALGSGEKSGPGIGEGVRGAMCLPGIFPVTPAAALQKAVIVTSFG